jgi:hypothetical protein
MTDVCVIQSGCPLSVTGHSICDSPSYIRHGLPYRCHMLARQVGHMVRVDCLAWASIYNRPLACSHSSRRVYITLNVLMSVGSHRPHILRQTAPLL